MNTPHFVLFCEDTNKTIEVISSTSRATAAVDAEILCSSLEVKGKHVAVINYDDFPIGYRGDNYCFAVSKRNIMLDTYTPRHSKEN